jgi:hypothetical protein
MSCRDREDTLKDLASGGPMTAALAAHLEACPACRERLERWRRRLDAIDGALSAALEVAPSVGFGSRLRDRLAREESMPHRDTRWLPALAAAVVAAAVGGWLFLGRSEAPAPRRAHAPPAHRDAKPSPLPDERVAPSVADTAEPPPPPPRGAATRPQRTSHAAPGPDRRAPAEPEVLIAPGQEEAIARYVRLLRQRRVEPGSLPAQAVSAEVDLREPEPLEVISIAPAPLAMESALEEGSGS